MGGRRRRDVLDVEQLLVHLTWRHTELGQHLAGVADHPVRAAQPPVVDLGDVADRRQQSVQALGVQPAAEQLDLAGFAGEDVHQIEACRVGVLQVGELVGEHDGVGPAVAVEQRDARLGVAQHRGGDRHERRDARSRADQHVPSRCLDVRHEAAGRRQRLDVVSLLDVMHEPRRHGAAGDLADPDPRRGTGGRADRVRAACLGAVDEAAHGQ